MPVPCHALVPSTPRALNTSQVPKLQNGLLACLIAPQTDANWDMPPDISARTTS